MRATPFTRPTCEIFHQDADHNTILCKKPASFTVEDAFACTDCTEELKKSGEDLTIRALDYTCEHCGVASLKRHWGPGWITCPACKKRALRASEI